MQSPCPTMVSIVGASLGRLGRVRGGVAVNIVVDEAGLCISPATIGSYFGGFSSLMQLGSTRITVSALAPTKVGIE